NPTTSPTKSCTNTPFANKADLQTAINDYLSCSDPADTTNCQVTQDYGYPMNAWCVGAITDMSSLFSGKSTFNEDISDWDTSSVTDMKFMFDSTDFNQPIGGWNTSSVTDMSYMFARSEFNQPIGGWDTSSVTTMWHMFFVAANFNQDLCEWRTYYDPSVDYRFMFYFATGCESKTSPSETGNWCKQSCP
ncbi:hypothetical protein ACHAXR_000246, partial [Thalassiosira sp. AJA248-18]